MAQKSGQNTNYKKPPFQTGLGGKVSYNKLMAQVKDMGSAQKKAIHLCRRKKKK